MTDIHIARVEKLLPGGDGVAYLEHEYEKKHHCFVRLAVPGDVLSLATLHKHKGGLRGVIDKLEKASPQRIEPACKVAASCGGCALQYLHMDAHAQIKSEWVKNAFATLITNQTLWQPMIAMDALSDSFRRRRVRWHVGVNEQKQPVLGFHAFQSHDVVESDTCMVISDALNDIRMYVQSALKTLDILPKSIYAVQLSDGIHVVLEYDGKSDANFPIKATTKNGLAVQYWCRDHQALRPMHKPVQQCYDTLPSDKGEIAVQIGPDDFVQGQFAGNEAMIQQILAWSKGANHVVDLFSGVGNLSLPLAASGMQVVGAEVNASSVRVANANAKRLKLCARYQQADLFADFDLADFVGADVLLVDPPRKGAKKICSMMNYLLPKKVILVHCDVLSAGRDALLMRDQGYQLRALRALDLFPFSGHVESMSLWAR